MTEREQSDDDPALEVFLDQRRRLINVAYRLLGSLAEAEDAVQETYARWYAMSPDERAAIDSPAAWATRVAGRICLDLLGSARARRERYVGEWLPEPVPGGTGWLDGRASGVSTPASDPADSVALDESLSMAFLVVLDSMTPAERVAFVLHDVFRYSFAEVAEIVGRTAAACRQLAVAARRKLPDSHEPIPATEREKELVTSFKQAWQAKDIPALIGLLDEGALSTADGGGRAELVFTSASGAAGVAEALVSVMQQIPGLTLETRIVNGRPGLVTKVDGHIGAVVAFDVGADRISRVWLVRNPDKIRAWTQPVP